MEIFQFFFTTKPPGKGTVIGLSLANDIILARYKGSIELRQELENNYGPYIPDIDYRSGYRGEIKEQLFKMLENHMNMIKHLINEKTWDFFAFVEIGVDRVHHSGTQATEYRQIFVDVCIEELLGLVKEIILF